jgi:hypothetical protein
MLSLVGFWLLVASGAGFVVAALMGDYHGLRGWLQPFGPWCCAWVVYGVRRKARQRGNNVA